MAVFLPIVPNWQNGVRDTYEFKTDVFTARDGSEQRRSLRVQPRRSIDVAVLLDGDRLRVFSDAINRAKDGKVLISDFSGDAAATTTTMADGGTLVSVDRIPTWLVDGALCVLLSGRKAQRVNVDFITGKQVVLSTPVSGAVGQGAQLLPMLPASLGTTNTLSVYTNLVATSALKFDVEPGSVVRVADPLPINGGPQAETTQFFGPAAIYYGRYVLLRKPNYLQQPKMAFNIAFETVDYNRGVTKTFAPVPIVSRTLTATYMAVSRAEALALLDIFVRAKGRAGEIYVPTWGHDLPKIISISGSAITVEGTDFYNSYKDDIAHSAILIRKTDGTLIPRQILGTMTIVGGNTRFVCEAAIGATVAQVSHVSWMFAARFAQDALTIEWLTNGKANVTLSFVTLANLAAEDNYGNNWILATGYWRDAGVWQDGSVWID